MSRFGIAARLAVLIVFTLLVIPLQLLALRFGWNMLHTLPMHFHRLVLRLFHVQVTEKGRPPQRIATLVVSNHVSWLDIPVLGSLRPLSFVAKSEIEAWPVVGLFAKLQRSVFIDRQRKRATAEVNSQVGLRLANGEVIVLFPEGTTGDGNRLLPFRSSIVGAAQASLTDPDNGPVLLQPLTIQYTHQNGMPVTRRERPTIAWYGDQELVPHLGHFVRNGPLDVVVTWGEPIPFNGNRKEATAAAEAAVRLALRAP